MEVPRLLARGPARHSQCARDLSGSGLQTKPIDRERECPPHASFSVMGFYTYNNANGDTGTASNSYNLLQDYGRAALSGPTWSSS